MGTPADRSRPAGSEPGIQACERTAMNGEEAYKRLEKAWRKASPYFHTAVYWGFVPGIVALGWATSDPKPALVQLISPL